LSTRCMCLGTSTVVSNLQCVAYDTITLYTVGSDMQSMLSDKYYWWCLIIMVQMHIGTVAILYQTQRGLSSVWITVLALWLVYSVSPMLSFHFLGSTGKRERLWTGEHRFPFHYTLPNKLPSSFHGRLGYIRYFCEATLERNALPNIQSRTMFSVSNIADVNTDPKADVSCLSNIQYIISESRLTL
jgi:hypothetical protein